MTVEVGCIQCRIADIKGRKSSGYADYRAVQKDMREIVTVKANIDHLHSPTGRKHKEIER